MSKPPQMIIITPIVLEMGRRWSIHLVVGSARRSARNGQSLELRDYSPSWELEGEIAEVVHAAKPRVLVRSEMHVGPEGEHRGIATISARRAGRGDLGAYLIALRSTYCSV
jgi:hypothetical protein